MKVLLVTSGGGHLMHLLSLKSVFEQDDRIWVTFDKPDAASALKGEKSVTAYGPTNRSLVNLVRNFFLALKVCTKERPELIVSAGAGVAVPFFWVGKLTKAKTLFIEVIDRIGGLTLSAKLVYPVADVIAVQWEELAGGSKKVEFWGNMFDFRDVRDS